MIWVFALLETGLPIPGGAFQSLDCSAVLGQDLSSWICSITSRETSYFLHWDECPDYTPEPNCLKSLGLLTSPPSPNTFTHAPWFLGKTGGILQMRPLACVFLAVWASVPVLCGGKVGIGEWDLIASKGCEKVWEKREGEWWQMAEGSEYSLQVRNSQAYQMHCGMHRSAGLDADLSFLFYVV